MGNLIGRRRLLAGAGGTAVSLAVQPWNRGWARTRIPSALDRTRRTVVAPNGTTLEATITIFEDVLKLLHPYMISPVLAPAARTDVGPWPPSSTSPTST